jgi:hypothetical protein
VRPRAAALLAVLSACGGGPRTIRVQPEGLSADFVFPVVRDPTGLPLKVLDRFALSAGMVVPGSQDPVIVPVELSSGREQLALVAFDRADLSSVEPSFDPSRLDAIALGVGAPPAPPDRRVQPDDHVLVDRALPGSVRILRLVDASPPSFEEAPPSDRGLLGELVLTLPSDPEYCRLAGDPGLVSFVVPVATSTRQFVAVRRADPEHVLALSLFELGLYARHASSDRPSTRIAIPSIAPGVYAARLSALALGSEPTSRTVLVSGAAQESDREDGVIWEFRLEAGAFRYVGTATRTRGRRLLDVMIDPHGVAVAVGEYRTLLVRESGEASFHLPTLAALETANSTTGASEVERVIATGDPMNPHFVGAVFRLFTGDAMTGQFASSELRPLSGETLSFTGLGAKSSTAGLELWAVGQPPSLYFRGPHDPTFGLVDPDLPPRYAKCLATGMTVPGHISDLALSSQAAYLRTDCSAVLRIRRSDHCVSTILPQDGTVVLEPDGFALRPLDLTDGLLTVIRSGDHIDELDLGGE